MERRKTTMVPDEKSVQGKAITKPGALSVEGNSRGQNLKIAALLSSRTGGFSGFLVFEAPFLALPDLKPAFGFSTLSHTVLLSNLICRCGPDCLNFNR